MQSRLPILDVLRGVAICLVVFVHALSWGFSPPNAVMGNLFWALTAFRMPVLILVSGYLLGVAAKNREKLVSRFSHLLWLLILWSIIANAFYLTFVYEFHHTDHFNVSRYLAQFKTPETYMWYIWVLVIYTGCYMAVVKMDRRITVAVAAAISMLSYSIARPDYFSTGNLLHYGFFFAVGALYKNELKDYISSSFDVSKIVKLVSVISIIHPIDATIRVTNGWQVFTAFERLAICLVAIELFKLLDFESRGALAIQWIGRNSLPIFLLHIPSIFLWRHVVPHTSTAIDVIYVPVAVSALAIAGSIAFERAMLSLGWRWLFEQPKWIANARRRIVIAQ